MPRGSASSNRSFSVNTSRVECRTCCIVKSIMHKLRLEAMLYDDMYVDGCGCDMICCILYCNLLPARLERGGRPTMSRHGVLLSVR